MRATYRRALRFAICTTALLAPTVAAAAEIEGVRFADRLLVRDQPLQLSSVGLLRYRVIFKGYVAGLYLGEGVASDSVLGDVPRRLEIEYFWPIEAEGFAKATADGISRNVDPDTFEGLRERIDRINRLYQNVKAGDRYALTYLPGVGTELSLNGVAKGLIEGADFAAALFAIWLGDRPLDRSLKKQLLAPF